MRENAVAEKSMEFAVRVLKLSGYLRREKHEYELASQLLRSGTSIGANIREAQYAHSRNDFLAKMQIALKEASETMYWLTLLHRGEILTQEQHESILQDCEEILRMLVSITKQTKAIITHY